MNNIFFKQSAKHGQLDTQFFDGVVRPIAYCSPGASDEALFAQDEL